MTESDLWANDDRQESPNQRLDRNWSELLQELRVTQTGVQILTGFLLTLPFQDRFADLDRVQVAVFLAAVLLASIATGLLVAPVALHRLLFRRRAKQILVTTADRLAKAGVVVLGLAVTTVTLLVFSVVLSWTAGLIAAGGIGVLYLVLWLVLPLLLRRQVQG